VSQKLQLQIEFAAICCTQEAAFSHFPPKKKKIEPARMFRQSTATPFSIIKLLGQNISTGHKKCHSSPREDE